MSNSKQNLHVSQLLAEIEKLQNQLLTVEPACFHQLEQWRKEAHASIDKFVDSKRHGFIEGKRNAQIRELQHLQNKIENIDEGVSNGRRNLEEIEHELNLITVKISEFEHLRLTMHPLNINEHTVELGRILPLPHPHHSLHLKTGNGCPIGSNDKHLLVDREGKHLTLIDRHLVIVREIPFTHDGIHDISWSNTLHRFIIILFREILTLDEETMKLTKCPIKNDVDWWRGSCSDTTLYLSTVEWGSSIYEFDLKSSFKLVRESHAPVTCSKDEIICDLKYAENHLAIPISNRHKGQSRIELRSATTLDCIWSVPIRGRCRCCPINGDQWLVMEHDDAHLFHISADGKLLKMERYEEHTELEDLTAWGGNQLAVLTKKHVNLHTLS